MEIKTEADIDKASAKALRKANNEPQHVFWNRVGVSQATGYGYESGRAPIPKHIRLMLFSIYVAGLKLDATTEEGVAAMKRLATLQHSDGADDRADKLHKAMQHIKQASKLLGDI